MSKYYRYVVGVDEDAKKGLDEVVEELKKQHPYLKHVSYNTAIKYLIEVWREKKQEAIVAGDEHHE